MLEKALERLPRGTNHPVFQRAPSRSSCGSSHILSEMICTLYEGHMG